MPAGDPPALEPLGEMQGTPGWKGLVLAVGSPVFALVLVECEVGAFSPVGGLASGLSESFGGRTLGNGVGRGLSLSAEARAGSSCGAPADGQRGDGEQERRCALV